jgi:cytochrome c oxidase accessory protein FixG
VSELPSSFRDNIATVDASGRRRWIYPAKPRGDFHRYRVYFSFILLAFLAFTPFIKANGYPIFMLNVVERRFILFGEPFWPQDLNILFLVVITGIIFIVVFTTIWGRLWCGWACPQTVFMEMVFRKIEFWIEGDGLAQKKLNAGPASWYKLSKKVAKHGIFIALSYVVSHLFLAWIIGVDSLWQIIQEPIAQHISGFIAINFFTLLFYGVFSWFREQACVIVCPYGRFQSVLLDQDTTVISYDFTRGEPRGKRSKNAESEVQKGDCVDCNQCVKVCPTGIDIRHGTQLECVNCTACIDACDHVMDKLGRPRGLIKFASYSQIVSGVAQHFNLRVKAYVLLLMALLGLSFYLLLSRPDIHVSVSRLRGSTYQTLADGSVINLYRVQFANNTFHDLAIHCRLKETIGDLRVQEGLVVPSYGMVETVVNVLLKPEELRSSKIYLDMEVVNGEQPVLTERLTFIGPRKF